MDIYTDVSAADSCGHELLTCTLSAAHFRAAPAFLAQGGLPLRVHECPPLSTRSPAVLSGSTRAQGFPRVGPLPDGLAGTCGLRNDHVHTAANSQKLFTPRYM